MNFVLSKSAIIAPVFLVIVGCGGASDDGDPAASGDTSFTGALIDSPVSGVSYATDTLSGLTSSSGQFEYKAGETVTFSIGDIVLGSNKGQVTITPLDLLNTNTVNDDAVVNMLRLLQTLDDDGMPSEGIEITSTTRNNALGVTIDFNQTITSFENDTSVTGLTQAPLVEAAGAISHFEGSLSAIGYVNGVVGAWSMDGVGGNETIVIMFTDAGTAVLVQTGTTDLDCPPPTCKDGIEVGSYTWNSTTGALSVNLSTDTNGEWGFSDSTNMSLTIDGDSATFVTDDSTNTFTRISGSSTPIHGGWGSSSKINGRDIFFIFFEDGKAVHLEAGAGDPYGQDGVEIATYTWNSTSGELSASVLVDTNGEWGFSDSTGMSFIVNGDDVTISAQDGSVDLDRIF